MSNSMPHPTSTQPQQQSALFASLERYPFVSDPDFQSGLSAILFGPSQSHNPADLILHARCFYYTRKYNVPIDASAYREWRARQPVERLASLEVPANLLAPGNAVMRDFVPTPEATPLKPGSAGARRFNGVGVETAGEAPAQSGQTLCASNKDVRPEEEAPASFQEIMELIREGKPIPGIKEIPETVLVGEGTGASKERRQKPWERRAQSGDTNGGLFGAGQR